MRWSMGSGLLSFLLFLVNEALQLVLVLASSRSMEKCPETVRALVRMDWRSKVRGRGF